MAQHRTMPLRVGLMLPTIEGDFGGAIPQLSRRFVLALLNAIQHGF